MPRGSTVATSGGKLRWPRPAADCPAEEMDAEDPLFILYTSGSTGKPKGVQHNRRLHGLHRHHKYIFDYHDGDVYWCTADIGWVTGHSYIVYGPLANGAITSCSKASRRIPTPAASGTWSRSTRSRQFYTAPTAIRALMREGDEFPKKRDLSSLKVLGSRRRADQPRGVAVVPPQRRPRELPDRRHLVADRDRRHPDHPAARRHAAQARFSATFPFFGVKPVVLNPDERPARRGQRRGAACCASRSRGPASCGPPTAIMTAS
jgi:acetyl-CoA synthetase